MKPTSIVQRTVRRLAQDVIASAEKAAAPLQPGSSSAYFNELPPILKSFFQKYPPAPFKTYSEKPTFTNAEDANPFLANKHPITNSWHKPKYSMRRQADLWKAAYRFGIEHLMPKLLHGRTFYEQRYATVQPPRGALYFKLSKGERSAPRREAEVQAAKAELDAKIAERKGKRFEKFVEKRRDAGFA